MPVSAVAERVLSSYNFLENQWLAVCGDFIGATERKPGHAWLLSVGDQNSVFLDLTADQFGLSTPHYGRWPDKQYSSRYEHIGLGVRESSKAWDVPVNVSLVAAGF